MRYRLKAHAIHHNGPESEIDRGEMHDGWSSSVLSEVVDFRKGKKPAELRNDPATGFVPYLDIQAIQEQNVRQFADVASSRLSTPSDVLVVWDGARSGLVGMAESGAIGSTIMALSPKLIDPRFLRHFIASQYDLINSNTRGTGIPHVDPEVFWNLKIPLAPLAEQRRIVAKLEEVLRKVSSSQQRLARIAALLKRFRQSVLAAACSGELTADWREEKTDVEASVVLLDRIDNERRSMSGILVERILLDDAPPNIIPDTWTWVRFGSVIGELRNGVSIRPNIAPPGTPILRISAARPGAVDLTDFRFMPESSRFIPLYTIKDGDLLFTRYNGSLELLGVCGMVRGIGKAVILYPDKLMRIRFDHNLILPSYAEVFFQVADVHDRIIDKSKSSAGQNGVSGSDIKNQPFVVPPLFEQHEIVRRVEQLFAFADQIDARFKKAQSQVERLTQSVLAKAFRGELVPTEAELARRENRSYESASELLDRIHTERNAQSKMERVKK